MTPPADPPASPGQPDAAAPTEERFAFGENWQSFLRHVDRQRIERAERSLREMLRVEDLCGRRLLDIGCGSGLFSLAAYRLGAEVVSLDIDPESVACTRTLRNRFVPSADQEEPSGSAWEIRQGSALDAGQMASLGRFDVVYAWGVLHHTGSMTDAIEQAATRVAPGGQFFLAIYNDQGGASRRWLAIKRFYHRLPRLLRPCWVALIAGFHEFKFAAARLARGRNPLPWAEWRAKREDRGMSAWHDWVDWIGGLPFEVAKPEQVILPLWESGFDLENLKTVGCGWGCNEFVFRRRAGTLSAPAGERS